MDHYLPHDATQASYLDLSSLLLHFHRRHARAALIRTVQMIDWLFFTPIRDGMANRMKELLEAGKPAIGSQLRFGNPAIAELFGLAGFDWLLIDSEHAPQTPNGVQAQLQAIGNTPATPIMRFPAVNVEQIRLYLDMGAMGWPRRLSTPPKRQS